MRHTSAKKIGGGLVVMGHFPRGNEWTFVPNRRSEKVIHFSSLLMFVACLRKRVGEGGKDIKFDKLPQGRLVVDGATIRTRKLGPQELNTFTDAYKNANEEQPALEMKSSIQNPCQVGGSPMALR